MADRNTGDASKYETKPKNPLLCSTVTGLSIDEFIHKAVLMPVDGASASGDASFQDPQQSSGNMPGYDRSASEQKNQNPKTEKIIPPSQPAKPPDDDFDLAAYYARVHGTQPLPVQSDIAETFSDVDLDTKSPEEDDTESVSSQMAPTGSMAMDLAQNLSQLPQVLPQVASAVLGSFSSVLNLTKSSPWGSDHLESSTRGYDKRADSNNFDLYHGFSGKMSEIETAENVENLAPVPLFDTNNFGQGFTEADGGSQAMMGSVQGNDKHSPSSSNLFRLGTNRKKTYAQVPGLTLGETYPPVSNFTLKSPQNPPFLGVTISHDQPHTQTQFPPPNSDIVNPNAPYLPEVFKPDINQECQPRLPPPDIDNVKPDFVSQTPTTADFVGIQSFDSDILNVDFAANKGYHVRYDSDTNNPYKRLRDSPVEFLSLQPTVKPIIDDDKANREAFVGEKFSCLNNTEKYSASARQTDVQSDLDRVDSVTTSHDSVGDIQNIPSFTSVTCPNYAYIPVSTNNIGISSDALVSRENFGNIPYNEVTSASASFTQTTQLENVQQPLFFDPMSFVTSQSVFQPQGIIKTNPSKAEVCIENSLITNITSPLISAIPLSSVESSNASNLPPSIPAVPPLASISGNQFRLGSKKRLQYYSGPVEGAISVSQNVSNLAVNSSIPSANNAPEIFNPTSGLADNFNVTQISTDLALGASYPDNLGQVQTGYFKSGERDFSHDNVSHSGIINHGYTDQDSSASSKQQNSGINFSLEKLQTAVNLSKIQNVVTSFFDPNFFADKKKIDSDLKPEDDMFSIQTVAPECSFVSNNQILTQSPTYYLGHQTSHAIKITNDNNQRSQNVSNDSQSLSSIPNYSRTMDANHQNNTASHQIDGQSQVRTMDVEKVDQNDIMSSNDEEKYLRNNFCQANQPDMQNDNVDASSIGAPLFFNPASCKPVNLTENVSESMPHAYHDGSEILRKAPANYFAKQKKDSNLAPISNPEFSMFNAASKARQDMIDNVTCMSNIGQNMMPVSDKDNNHSENIPILFSESKDQSSLAGNLDNESRNIVNLNAKLSAFNSSGTKDDAYISTDASSFFDNNEDTANVISIMSEDSNIINDKNACESVPNYFNASKQTNTFTNSNKNDNVNSSATHSNLGTFRLSPTQSKNFSDPDDTQMCVIEPASKEDDDVENDIRVDILADDINTKCTVDAHSGFEKESFDNKNHSVFGTSDLSVSNILADEESRNILQMYSSEECSASTSGLFYGSNYNVQSTSKSFFDDLQQKNQIIPETDDAGYVNRGFNEGSAEEFDDNISMVCNISAGLSSIAEDDLNSDDQNSLESDNEAEKDHVYLSDDLVLKKNQFQGFDLKTPSVTSETPSLVEEMQSYNLSGVKDNIETALNINKALNEAGTSSQKYNILPSVSTICDINYKSILCEDNSELTEKKNDYTEESKNVEDSSLHEDSFDCNLAVGSLLTGSGQHLSAFVPVKNFSNEELQNETYLTAKDIDVENVDIDRIGQENIGVNYISPEQNIVESGHIGSDNSIVNETSIPDKVRQKTISESDHFDYSNNCGEDSEVTDSEISQKDFSNNETNIGFGSFDKDGSYDNSGFLDGDDSFNIMSEHRKIDHGNKNLPENVQDESKLSNEYAGSFPNRNSLSFHHNLSSGDQNIHDENTSFITKDDFLSANQDLSNANKDGFFRNVSPNFIMSNTENSKVTDDNPIPFFNPFAFGLVKEQPDFVGLPNAIFKPGNEISKPTIDSFDNLQLSFGSLSKIQNNTSDAYQKSSPVTTMSVDSFQNITNASNNCQSMASSFFNSALKNNDKFDSVTSNKILVESNHMLTANSDGGKKNIVSIKPSNDSYTLQQQSSIPTIDAFKTGSEPTDAFQELLSDSFQKQSKQESEVTSDNHVKQSSEFEFNEESPSVPAFNMFSVPTVTDSLPLNSEATFNQTLNCELVESTTNNMIEPPIAVSNNIPPQTVNVFRMPVLNKSSSGISHTSNSNGENSPVTTAFLSSFSSAFNQTTNIPRQPSNETYNLPPMYKAPEGIPPIVLYPIENQSGSNQHPSNLPPMMMPSNCSVRSASPLTNRYPKIPSPYQTVSNFNQIPSQIDNTASNVFQPVSDTRISANQIPPSNISQFPGNFPPRGQTPTNLPPTGQMTSNISPLQSSLPITSQVPPNMTHYQGNLPPRGRTSTSLPPSGRMGTILSDFPSNSTVASQIPPNISQYHGNFPPRGQTPTNLAPIAQTALTQLQGNLPPRSQTPPYLNQHQGMLPPTGQNQRNFPVTGQLAPNLPPLNWMPSNNNQGSLPLTGQFPRNAIQYQGNLVPNKLVPNPSQAAASLPPTNRMTPYLIQNQNNSSLSCQFPQSMTQNRENLPPSCFPPNTIHHQGNLPPANQFPPSLIQNQGNLPATRFPPNMAQYQNNISLTSRISPHTQNSNQFQQPGNTANQFLMPLTTLQGGGTFPIPADNNNIQSPTYFMS